MVRISSFEPLYFDRNRSNTLKESKSSIASWVSLKTFWKVLKTLIIDSILVTVRNGRQEDMSWENLMALTSSWFKNYTPSGLMVMSSQMLSNKSLRIYLFCLSIFFKPSTWLSRWSAIFFLIAAEAGRIYFTLSLISLKAFFSIMEAWGLFTNSSISYSHLIKILRI